MQHDPEITVVTDDLPETGETDPVAAEPASDELPTLERQLADALAERDANHDRFLRSQAEFENYRKRMQREAVMHNLPRAAEAARTADETSDLVQGIDLVLQQIEQTLASHGVTPIPAVGETFDPHLHEAMTQMPSAEHPPMTILQELERGYKLHDRVVRPGKVIVAQAAQ